MGCPESPEWAADQLIPSRGHHGGHQEKARQAREQCRLRYRYRDGRWVARISAGCDQDGRPIRKTVYAQTQAEAQAKLIQLRTRYQGGSLAIQRGRTPTLRTYLADWLALLRAELSAHRTAGLSAAGTAMVHEGHRPGHRQSSLPLTKSTSAR